MQANKFSRVQAGWVAVQQACKGVGIPVQPRERSYMNKGGDPLPYCLPSTRLLSTKRELGCHPKIFTPLLYVPPIRAPTLLSLYLPEGVFHIVHI
ncbi:hypothetical protein V1478_003721 [Vespula squamosa]|uniref:Uncharacterized protein n=1 Tax=Vespula squamosa TaxID=30214 RepID=A0ABD2BML6_VESSQ